MKNESIVFAIWKDNELVGFRADTFNTISPNQPKIYTYSKEQVEVVLKGIRQSLNRSGTTLAKVMSKLNIEHNFEDNLVKHMSQQEQDLINLKEFEIRVHPFIDMEDIFTYPEQWKVDADISNLKEAIETHKFRVMDFFN